MTAILRYARTEMRATRVIAHISVDNIASARTAEKLSFVKSGERYSEIFRGAAYPHDIYCLSMDGGEYV